MTSPSAPTRELGYAQIPVMSTSGVSTTQWWMYEDETTPELRWPQSVFVYDQMRRQDSQVVSVLRAVTLPVRRTPWRIDPAGARDEVVQLVAEDLGLPIVGRELVPLPRTRDRFSWTDHLREALLMLPFGHSYFEQLYRIVNEQARLRKLAVRMPKTIEEITVARDGGLVSITQYALGGGVSETPIPVSRLVAYIHEGESGNWLGTSLLRPAYKNWLLKDRLLRVQAQTIERNGMGIPVYTAAPSEKNTDNGLKLATSLRSGESAGAALPAEAQLRLMGVEGQLPDAEPAIRYHDEQIGRAVLAHFLNLGTQTGSWALGSTFADFFTLSLQTLAQQIADVATQHIVEDLVDLNFGEGEPAPKIVFDEIGSRQVATAEAIRSLIDAGVITPDEVLESAVRQQFGLPPKDPDAASPPTPEEEDFLTDPSEVFASAGPESDVDDDPIGDLDDELDDETLVLLQAMFEFEVEQGKVQAAGFNPELHKRWPKGHPKAGKFRPMVDILKLAITHHQRHGGDGHPFQNFKREQLLKAAKTRGISLKKGESQDSIAAKLLADLGGTATKPAPAKKAEPAKKAATKKLPAAPKVKAADDALTPMPGAKVAAGDFSGLKRVGPSEGTTPGGVFEAADGSRWYVKAQKSAEHANNEALASALYRAAGIDVPAVVRGKGTPGLPGENHTATRMVDGAVSNLAFKLSDDAYIGEIRKGFAADAWLANWDVVGEGSEHPWGNIVEGADGRPHRIDVGGAILFRGMGGEKGDAFGPKVVEFDTMRTPSKGRRHALVFAEMTEQQLSESVDRIKKITNKKIHDLVAEHGMDPKVAELLIARRQDLLSRMKAKPAPKGWKNAATGQAALDAAPVTVTGSISETRGLLEKAGLDPDTAQWATSGFHHYQDGLYGAMNRAMLEAAGGDLRAGSYYGLDDDGISMIEGMREATKVSKLTKDVIVYRGERAPARNFPPGVWSLTGGMEGMEWTFHAFGSSSADEDIAKDFARGPTTATADLAQPTVMRILARKGTPAVSLQGTLETEQELVLGDGLKYRVVKDYGVVDEQGYSKGIRRLDVEVVPA